MAKRVKYKIGDKTELDDRTEEYDMLGNIPEFQAPDSSNIYDDDSPSVGDREPVPHVVVVNPVIDGSILELVGIIVTTNSPTRLLVRGLNVRSKNQKRNVVEIFVIQM